MHCSGRRLSSMKKPHEFFRFRQNMKTSAVFLKCHSCLEEGVFASQGTPVLGDLGDRLAGADQFNCMGFECCGVALERRGNTPDRCPPRRGCRGGEMRLSGDYRRQTTQKIKATSEPTYAKSPQPHRITAMNLTAELNQKASLIRELGPVDYARFINPSLLTA